MTRVLHITHTDIRSDSRIIKEMQTLAVHLDCEIKGLGIVRDDEAHFDSRAMGDKITLEVVKVYSRKIRFVPKAIRHVATLLEFYSKVTFRALQYKPEVVHCHDTLSLPLGALIKLIVGSRLIYDAHELESNRNGISSALGKAVLTVEKLLWKYIDSLIVVSPSIAAWYGSNVGAKPTSVILNAPVYRTESSTGSASYLRERFSIAKNSKIFIYVGVLGRGRGLELILDAFRQPEVHSSVVFLGYGELKDKLLRESKLRGNIFVHEAVPHDQVVPIAKSADFGLCLIENVSLSDFYCLPNKLFEYGFAGIPGVYSNFPDMADVVNKHGLGICCDPDLPSLLASIKKIEAGHVTASFADLDRLSWRAQEKTLHSLYSRLMIEERRN